MSKSLVAVVVGALALVGAPAGADTHGKKAKRSDRPAAHDCTPYTGPSGYRGNPWCDGGYKYAEDYAPGTGPFLDLLDLPQLRRLERWWN